MANSNMQKLAQASLHVSKRFHGTKVMARESFSTEMFGPWALVDVQEKIDK